MAIEVELSIMAQGPDPANDLRPALERFEALHGVRVRVQTLPWETAWTTLVKAACYQFGPDVSMVGTTWISNLVAMHALRSFTAHEIAEVGGASVFLPSAWQSASLAEGQETWAIPWLADTRLIYYRRDLLQGAGVDERTAFHTPERLQKTLDRLQASGIEVPWVVPTRLTLNTLHNIATWVWGAGGDFISTDGRRTLFAQPETRGGIRAYFALHRYLSPPARGLDASQSDALFWQGQAAVTISGPWMLSLMRAGSETVAPQVIANLGVALPPGIPFVGGSNLVIWQHTYWQQEAAALVRYLADREVQGTYVQRSGQLPVRIDILSLPPFTTDPLHQVLSQALKTGRSFPSTTLWGLVEDKLTAAFKQLWAEVLADPDLDLDAAIGHHLDPLAQRLDLTLAQRSQGR